MICNVSKTSCFILVFPLSNIIDELGKQGTAERLGKMSTLYCLSKGWLFLSVAISPLVNFLIWLGKIINERVEEGTCAGHAAAPASRIDFSHNVKRGKLS